MKKEEFITERTRIISEMLDNPDKYGIYPTSRCFVELDLLYDKVFADELLADEPAEKVGEESINFMQARDLTYDEWMKLPKEEIFKLYCNVYKMLTGKEIIPSEGKQDKEHSEKLGFDVLKQNGSYKVQFFIGNQYFTLDYEGKKGECNWMIRMLKHAFKEHAEQYHNTRIRDELIKLITGLNKKFDYSLGNPEQIVDEYLKTKT